MIYTGIYSSRVTEPEQVCIDKKGNINVTVTKNLTFIITEKKSNIHVTSTFQINGHRNLEQTQPATSAPSSDACSCRDPLAEVGGSCSSLASGALLGACGGAESDGSNSDVTAPLLPQSGVRVEEAASAVSQGDYMDMRSVSSSENLIRAANMPTKNIVREQHIYSNPLQEVGDGPDVYTKPNPSTKPSEYVREENAYSSMSKNVKKSEESKSVMKNEMKEQHTYSNVDDPATENHYETLP